MLALLIKNNLLVQENLKYYYFDKGVPKCITKGLYYSGKNFYAKEAKTYLSGLLPELADQGVDTLFVCDAGYFKVLTGQVKTEYCYGQFYPCKLDNRFKVLLGLNYMAFKYDPSLLNKLQTSIDCLKGNTSSEEVITKAEYSDEHLMDLLAYPKLAVDIETRGLQFYKCGIVSIAFGIDKHSGIAFRVTDKAKLREFFEKYEGTLIFHNASFDVKVLIYELFMKDINDQEGLQYGLHTMYKDIEDTKIIAYLALNSTGKPSYKLKDLAFEYTGKYALDDIGDIDKVDTATLLKYNLTDVCATWYVYEKYKPIMIADNQESLYKELLIPTQKVLTHTEMNGLYMDMTEVPKLKEMLKNSIDEAHNKLVAFDEVKQAEKELAQIKLDKINAKLKKKKKESINFKINLRSSDQLRYLLYDVLKLPVLRYTKAKAPSTSKDAIVELKQYCSDNQKELMDNLIEFANSTQIMNNFIPAMEDSFNSRLYGNFNIGGTVSGRLSSSNPNLQNLPSTGTPWAKPFKKCFKAPKGFVFCGSDFSSLEDHISALITKDPQKLKVYLEKFDGHCLRAYSYYKHLMPDITRKLEYLDKGGKFYKVTYDDGSVDYLSEFDETFKNLGETK